MLQFKENQQSDPYAAEDYVVPLACLSILFFPPNELHINTFLLGDITTSRDLEKDYDDEKGIFSRQSGDNI